MFKRFVKYWYFGYLILLAGGVFYVNTILNQNEVKVDKEKPNKVAIEEKFVDVSVLVDNGKTNKTYRTKLKNIDSVYDVFDEIREDSNFFYQISGYLYGTEVDCINDTCATDGYKWIVYKDNVDITSVLKDTSLDDDTSLVLKLEKK